MRDILWDTSLYLTLIYVAVFTFKFPEGSSLPSLFSNCTFAVDGGVIVQSWFS